MSQCDRAAAEPPPRLPQARHLAEGNLLTKLHALLVRLAAAAAAAGEELGAGEGLSPEEGAQLQGALRSVSGVGGRGPAGWR